MNRNILFSSFLLVISCGPRLNYVSEEDLRNASYDRDYLGSGYDVQESALGRIEMVALSVLGNGSLACHEPVLDINPTGKLYPLVFGNKVLVDGLRDVLGEFDLNSDHTITFDESRKYYKGILFDVCVQRQQYK